MNVKWLYGFGILALVVVVLFVFVRKDKSIVNYPSNGVDIIAFGDSLVQGVGATTVDNNFVSLLSKRIGKPIVNLGISGDTTMDGIKRLGEFDKYKPKVVLLLLGGNDYLRKVPIDETFSNLGKIITDLQKRGAVVLVLGVRGGVLNDKFESRFEDLSEKYDTAYVSNVLSGLITNTQYMSDAIHPNDFGYKKIEERIYPVLAKLLK